MVTLVLNKGLLLGKRRSKKDVVLFHKKETDIYTTLAYIESNGTIYRRGPVSRYGHGKWVECPECGYLGNKQKDWRDGEANCPRCDYRGEWYIPLEFFFYKMWRSE